VGSQGVVVAAADVVVVVVVHATVAVDSVDPAVATLAVVAVGIAAAAADSYSAASCPYPALTEAERAIHPGTASAAYLLPFVVAEVEAIDRGSWAVEEGGLGDHGTRRGRGEVAEAYLGEKAVVVDCGLVDGEAVGCRGCNHWPCSAAAVFGVHWAEAVNIGMTVNGSVYLYCATVSEIEIGYEICSGDGDCSCDSDSYF
jgi:hypothetical protein